MLNLLGGLFPLPLCSSFCLFRLSLCISLHCEIWIQIFILLLDSIYMECCFPSFHQKHTLFFTTKFLLTSFHLLAKNKLQGINLIKYKLPILPISNLENSYVYNMYMDRVPNKSMLYNLLNLAIRFIWKWSKLLLMPLKKWHYKM